MTETADERSAGRILAALYRGIDGYPVTRDGPDGRRLSFALSLIYGELTTAGIAKLARGLGLGESDVFYDLGSGTGKVVLQLALTMRLRKCIGVEIAADRFAAAREVLRQANARGLVRTAECDFRNEDLLDADLADATVVYTCSTCFSQRLMRRLGRKLRALDRPLTLVSLQAFRPATPRRFREIDKLILPTTWNRRQEAHVYRVEPA